MFGNTYVWTHVTYMFSKYCVQYLLLLSPRHDIWICIFSKNYKRLVIKMQIYFVMPLFKINQIINAPFTTKYPTLLLIPRVFDDPRSCQMDGRVISTHKGSWSSRYTCKKASGQGVWTHPPMILLAMVRERYKSVDLLLDIRRLPGDPLLLRMKTYIYSFGGTVLLINGEEIFYVVMMIIGVSRSIITLRAAVRNHGRWCGCQRSWEVIM